jgi:acetyltransferase-like isoleucine patch superfamily enzyme
MNSTDDPNSLSAGEVRPRPAGTDDGAGRTEIGKNCYVGSGSNIIDNIKVGDGTLVGLGTTLLKSLPANSKVVGNPARSI